jgi:protein-tyrosine phosphatase
LVPELVQVMAGVGPELVRYPIRDPHVPTDLASFEMAIRDLVTRLGQGQSVAIACRGGIDRSGMAAAALLVEAGMAPKAAIQRVQTSRRRSITLPDQQALVHAWRRAASDDVAVAAD